MNPNNPPKFVESSGDMRSDQEMFTMLLIYVTHLPGDEDLVLDPVLIENLLEKSGGLDLVARRVRSIDAQVLLHQLNRHVLIARPVDFASILSSTNNAQKNEA